MNTHSIHEEDTRAQIKLGKIYLGILENQKNSEVYQLVLKDQERGIELLKKALPNSDEAAFLLAQVYLRSGELNAAKEMLTKTSIAGSAPAIRMLGEVALSDGDFRAAVNLYNEASARGDNIAKQMKKNESFIHLESVDTLCLNKDPRGFHNLGILQYSGKNHPKLSSIVDLVNNNFNLASISLYEALALGKDPQNNAFNASCFAHLFYCHEGLEMQGVDTDLHKDKKIEYLFKAGNLGDLTSSAILASSFKHGNPQYVPGIDMDSYLKYATLHLRELHKTKGTVQSKNLALRDFIQTSHQKIFKFDDQFEIPTQNMTLTKSELTALGDYEYISHIFFHPLYESVISRIQLIKNIINALREFKCSSPERQDAFNAILNQALKHLPSPSDRKEDVDTFTEKLSQRLSTFPLKQSAHRHYLEQINIDRNISLIKNQAVQKGFVIFFRQNNEIYGKLGNKELFRLKPKLPDANENTFENTRYLDESAITFIHQCIDKKEQTGALELSKSDMSMLLVLLNNSLCPGSKINALKNMIDSQNHYSALFQGIGMQGQFGKNEHIVKEYGNINILLDHLLASANELYANVDNPGYYISNITPVSQEIADKIKQNPDMFPVTKSPFLFKPENWDDNHKKIGEILPFLEQGHKKCNSCLILIEKYKDRNSSFKQGFLATINVRAAMSDTFSQLEITMLKNAFESETAMNYTEKILTELKDAHSEKFLEQINRCLHFISLARCHDLSFQEGILEALAINTHSNDAEIMFQNAVLPTAFLQDMSWAVEKLHSMSYYSSPEIVDFLQDIINEIASLLESTQGYRNNLFKEANPFLTYNLHK